MFRFIGDVHGKFERYKTILENSPLPTIQVGDMGIGFFKWPQGTPVKNPPYDKMVEYKARFIRGNHDNPAQCKTHTQYIPDGTVEGKTLFVGGGLSIDKMYRVEGFSYWPTEELSIEELNAMTDKYLALKPRMMVTHECPEEVAIEIVAKHTGRRQSKLDCPSRTRQAFTSMWQQHIPEIWVFGHWHMSFDHVLNGTRFICLPELETIDLELL